MGEVYRAKDTRLVHVIPASGEGRKSQISTDGGDRRALESRRTGADVAPDGKRFLVNAMIEAAVAEPLTLLQNWPAAHPK